MLLSKLKNLLKPSVFVNYPDQQPFYHKIDKLQISNGKVLSAINQQFKTAQILDDIRCAEFQVFSQWGDDGIIQFLVNYLDIENKTFVEFGVESYTECNTRFLLVNNNWRGLIIDGSLENINKVKSENIYWQFDLTALHSFVTAENINGILSQHQFTGEVGLFHIDIDGNDYWIWNALENISPVIMIVEYNSVFGYDNPWTIPYDASFVRSKAHHSNLYYGTSILSICELAQKKGYGFVGCNSNGNNAYFVRNDKLKDLKVKSLKEGYVRSTFSESRDTAGSLTFLRGAERLKGIEGMPVYNTETFQIEKITG
jgi:cold shock CspA family protein